MNKEEFSNLWWLTSNSDTSAPSAGNRIWRHRFMRLGFIWGVWTLVGLFFSSQLYFYFMRTERPLTFSRALLWQFSAVYLLALATPVVLWLSRRFRIERQNWLRSLSIHALTGLLFATLMTACHVVIDISFSRGLSYLTPLGLVRNTFANLDKNLIIYWLIVLISHAFNYYRRYRESELTASQLATRLAEAQLDALKMQLHPHFLFNTLHSISSLINKDPEAARKMISRLGDFLRLTLENSGTQEVRLQQELEFLKCYLEIERIRFYDRLTTHIDVDPQVLSWQVPNLILQPIVENAIRHGVAPRSTPGRIEVTARRSNGMLRLQVKDNGPGLLAGKSYDKKMNKGIGLSNTRSRLIQLYGNAHHFEMSNDPQGGLVVTLDIP
jgi:two-component system LytT family sensor kinase